MAAAVAQNKSKQMERLTTCPICLDKFRIPKVLPCMHTFCLTPCLTNLVDPRDRFFRCPECRREHQIPPGLRERLFIYVVTINILLLGGVQAFPSSLPVTGSRDVQPSQPSTNDDIPDRCFICKQQKLSKIN
jgi:hypothetical protein